MKKISVVLILLLIAVSTFSQTITVAEAIVIGQALEENNVPTVDTYTIEGYVNTIDENSFNTSYNNMTFWIADTRGSAHSSANGALQCYRSRPDRELQVGDKVRVVSTLKRWNADIETAQLNAPATWLESQEAVTGSLRVCAQNLENYYYNYTQTSRPSYTDEAGFRAKTQKIVNAMLDIDADIYAFCEVEAKPIVLQQLADSMNTHAGSAGRYASVYDGIDYTWYEGISDNQIKSGFIYRTDKVATVGNNTAASPGNGYYAHTMRIQAFKQLSNNEKLVLSMNHFKAKDSSADQGNSTRESNASNLVSALGGVATDPDILVLGDLNCEVGESPLATIINAGFEEQLLKYDAYAWSHCYDGGELIDHVFANSSMAAQIVNAYVLHRSAYKCNPMVTSDMSWSDHDPYVVEINLGSPVTPEGECADLDVTYLTSGLDDMTTAGEALWKWDPYNYAKGSKSGGYTGYLMTPALNMKDKKSVSLSFQHAHKFAGTPSEELTLWVTPDYQGTVEASTWHQLTIDPYTDNNSWTWANVSIDVPVNQVGQQTVFAFKYMSTATNYATWEIKNLHISAKCDESTGVESVYDSRQAQKILRNGQIIILRNGVEYTITGQQLR